MSQDTIELLLKRRSAKAAMLAEPGPTAQQLEGVLAHESRSNPANLGLAEQCPR